MNESKINVLFVCVENSCRSQIAEAFMRMRGTDRIDVFSAGSNPSGSINTKAIEVMREYGYDLNTHRSKSVSEIPDIEYDFVITMGCGDGCPFVKAVRREDWSLPDPKSLPMEKFKAVCDQIGSKVKDLIVEISDSPNF